jgi:hypothetical protein
LDEFVYEEIDEGHTKKPHNDKRNAPSNLREGKKRTADDDRGIGR